MKKLVENLEKTVVMYKGKCSELSRVVEENKKKNVGLEGKVEELKGYKLLCMQLQEKVLREEENFRVVSEREKEARQDAILLAADLGKIKRRRCEEVVEFNEKVEDLKQKVEKAVEEEKKTFKEYMMYKMLSAELKQKVCSLEENCRVASEKERKAIEDVSSLLSDLEKINRIRNEELAEFKRKLENVKQTAGSEIENIRKTYKELEERMNREKFTLEKDLERHKVKHEEFKFQLSIEAEERMKKIVEMENKLDEFKEYKVMCEKLKEKIVYLEENCEIVSEREKKAIQKLTTLYVDLEIACKNSEEELIETEAKCKNLECEKQKIEDALQDQIKKCRELEKMREIAVEVEKEMDMYKTRCSELSITIEEKQQESVLMVGKLEESMKYKTMCDELIEKVVGLEETCMIVSEREESALARVTSLSSDLAKIKNEMKVQKKRYKRLETRLAKLKSETSDVITDTQVLASVDKHGKRDKSKPEKVQSDTNGELNGASLSKLKIKLKPLSCEVVDSVRDCVEADSTCPSETKPSGGTEVTSEFPSTLKRKRRPRYISRCDGEGDGLVRICKAKAEHTKTTPIEQCEGTPKTAVPLKRFATSGDKCKKVESPPSENVKDRAKSSERQSKQSPMSESAKEKAKLAERQSKRTVHPPKRLNL
ncbi:hypothetical protein ACHQM5_004615 [Ranunculus cassubicifolius]